MSILLPEPSTHSYLGDSLEDVHQRVYYEENEKLSIPVVFLENIVLFPTETLPLRVHDANFVSFLQTYQQNRSQNNDNIPILIGVIGKFRRKTGSGLRSLRWNTSIIGTVAEATATKFEEEEAVIKAKGRYRFRLLPVKDDYNVEPNTQRYQQRTVGGVRLHDVELLEGEEEYSNTAQALAPTAHILRPSLTCEYLEAPWSSLSAKRCYQEQEYYAQGMNHFPCWLQRLHNPSYLQREIIFLQRFLESKSRGITGIVNPIRKADQESPTQFSYRVASQMIVSDEDRQGLLESSNIVRLRTILNHFVEKVKEQCEGPESCGAWSDIGIRSNETREMTNDSCEVSNHHQSSLPQTQDITTPLVQGSSLHNGRSSHPFQAQVSVLLCESCEVPLAKESEVFQVPGADGTIGAYVNPHGVVHQTLTLKQMLSHHATHLTGSPSSEDSWFPGYSWTIAYCANCSAHLGWRFTLDGVGDNSVTSEECDRPCSIDENEYMSDDSTTPQMRLSEIASTNENQDVGDYVMSIGIPNIDNMNSLDPPRCQVFWGIRRSAVRLSSVSVESLDDSIKRMTEHTDDGVLTHEDQVIENEVERLLEIYTDNLGIVLPAPQLATFRAQLRELIRGNSANAL